MKVRECYERFVTLPLPDQTARRLYSIALETWEQHSGNPDFVDINEECLVSFKKACQATGLPASACNHCWGYIRGILMAAFRNGVAVPYLEHKRD